MNISIDSKVLAIANRTGNRTGVYRYASILASRLTEITGVRLKTICTDFLDTPWATKEIELLNSQQIHSTETWEQYFKLTEAVGRHKNKMRNRNRFTWWGGRLATLKHFQSMPPLSTINDVRLCHQLSKDNTDIFHSPFHIVPNVICGLQKPVILRTIHDLLPLTKPQYFLRNSTISLEKAINSITKNEHIICVSNSTRNEIVRVLPWVKDDQLHVIPLAGDSHSAYNADEADWELFCKKQKIRKSDKIFLAVGTIEPRKNYVNLIKGFEMAVQDTLGPDLRLILVGGLGWKYSQILEKINESPVSSRILMLGSIPDPLLACLYTKATATLSVSWAEGFGLPLLESMKYNTPVIASSISAHLEIAKDSAYFIDPNSPLEICQAILNIAASDSQRKHWCLLGKSQAEKFTWEKTLNATATCYKQIMGKENRQ